MRTLSLLALLDVYECNGIYQQMVIERIENLAKIKSCDVLDLTLGELVSCIEAAALDFNEQSPSIFPGHTPRAESAVRERFTEVLQ
jgi:hypothetical protein